MEKVWANLTDSVLRTILWYWTWSDDLALRPGRIGLWKVRP
jgi:hypothetical protein